jgi:hypothetical protein
MVLEIAIRRSIVETQGSVFEKYSQIMIYANDVVMGRQLPGGEEVFTSLVEQTNEMGLEINLKKRQNL